MTKSELISALVRKKTQLSAKDVELVVHTLLECMSVTLANGERIEIRGFGSFTLHYRPPRLGATPSRVTLSPSLPAMRRISNQLKSSESGHPIADSKALTARSLALRTRKPVRVTNVGNGQRR